MRPAVLRSSPRKRGPRGQALGRLQVWAPTSVGANGECYSVRSRLFSCHRAGAVGELQRAKRKSAPVCGSGPGGRPHSLLPSPSQPRGSARRQGAWPGLRQTGPGARDSRASPDRRALGVKRHAPRLAARQRGILAFMPLTVVGPGRLLVAGEAARARPGDEVASSIARRCRSRSPPTKTPPEDAPRRVDRDGRNITTLKVKSSTIFTAGVILYGE